MRWFTVSDCRKLQAPFSSNYCRDWVVYHVGGPVVLAGVFLVLVPDHPVIVGTVLIAVGLVTGTVNYLIDKSLNRDAMRLENAK